MLSTPRTHAFFQRAPLGWRCKAVLVHTLSSSWFSRRLFLTLTKWEVTAVLVVPSLQQTLVLTPNLS